MSRTLASVERAVANWGVQNGDKQPHDYAARSNKKVWIRCDNCGREYTQRASDVENHGCALCVNKTERKLYRFLKEMIKDASWTTQAKFSWSQQYRYDFWDGVRCLVELDGPQHFCPVKSWKSGWDIVDKDVEKEKLATEAKMFIVRVFQPDVSKDQNGWDSYLLDAMRDRHTRVGVAIPNHKNYMVGSVYARARSDVSFF